MQPTLRAVCNKFSEEWKEQTVFVSGQPFLEVMSFSEISIALSSCGQSAVVGWSE